MEVKNTFLHSFWGSNILDKDDHERFSNRLKLILKYSLVSYNYYWRHIRAIEGDLYKQHWRPNVRGYSQDYVCLMDSEALCNQKDTDIMYSSINKYNLVATAYIVLKRKWIEELIEESRKTYTIPSKPLAMNYDFIDIRNLNQHYDYEEMAYVIPGEVKVKNQIPFEEISGLAICSGIMKKEYNRDLIKRMLEEVEMENFPLYSMDDESRWLKQESNLVLTKTL